MINVHCTKKLLSKLPVDEMGYLPVSKKSAFLLERETDIPGLLGAWHANFLTIQRRNCVLLVHDETRFPLFIPALKKADFSNLDYWFDDALMNTLIKCCATEQQMNKAWGAVQRLKIDTQCDRSVQGTMNRMGQEIEHILWYDDVNVADITGYRLAAYMAEGPCTIKGRKDFIVPAEEFLALLDRLPEPEKINAPMEESEKDELETLSGNVVDMKNFRNRK